MSDHQCMMGLSDEGQLPKTRKEVQRMTDTKHTKRDLFTTLFVLASAAEAEPWVTDGIQHEIDLLDKRKGSSGSRKNPEQEREMGVIASILAEAPAEGMKATPIATAMGASVQKVSALLRKMVADGTVKRNTEKKETFFTLA